MLSRRVLAIAHTRRFLVAGRYELFYSTPRTAHPTPNRQAYARTAFLHSSRRLQGIFFVFAPLPLAHPATAEIIKVPQMAESINEGTLKSWSKQVGDAVAADEEVATIETDKVCPSSSHLLSTNFSQIDVSVNAPQAGTIVQLLANEEATVTVGQDLFVIEFGEGTQAPASSQPAPSSSETSPAIPRPSTQSSPETPPATPQPPSESATPAKTPPATPQPPSRELKDPGPKMTQKAQEHRGETRVYIPLSLVALN